MAGPDLNPPYNKFPARVQKRVVGTRPGEDWPLELPSSSCPLLEGLGLARFMTRYLIKATKSNGGFADLANLPLVLPRGVPDWMLISMWPRVGLPFPAASVVGP